LIFFFAGYCTLNVKNELMKIIFLRTAVSLRNSQGKQFKNAEGKKVEDPKRVQTAWKAWETIRAERKSPVQVFS